MDFGIFVEGPLLRVVFLIVFAGIITRICFFLYVAIKADKNTDYKLTHLLSILGRAFVPFHSAITKQPIYAILRYIFHICLIVVPIWLSGHVALWEESRFEWGWTALPDVWADWMTVLFLALATYFLIRRLILPDIRLSSTASDYLLIIITGLPFMTGYFLMHGSLDAIPFLGDNMRIIHVLSGETMLLCAVFLFYTSQLNSEKCTGCAACEVSCPTGTLESKDAGKLRIFDYSHYQCICCGMCVNVCPEDAAGLRHELRLGRFFEVVPKREIRSVELRACERCGKPVAPIPQLDKIGKTITDDYVRLCPRCRKDNLADTQYKMVPWPKHLKQPISKI